MPKHKSAGWILRYTLLQSDAGQELRNLGTIDIDANQWECIIEKLTLPHGG